MADRTRNPLDFGIGDRGSFVQRFVLAEVLGPPRGRARRRDLPTVLPPPPADAKKR